MKKTLLALAAALVLISGTAGSAFSMSTLPPPPPTRGCDNDCPPPKKDGGPDPLCIIDCVPTIPDPQDEADAAADVCNAGLGKLRKVTEEQVIEFANQEGVKIVPLCERNGTIQRLAHIDPSQAIPVRDEIAANPALEGPLGKRGFDAEHVVGVIIGELGATLYVHKGA